MNGYKIRREEERPNFGEHLFLGSMPHITDGSKEIQEKSIGDKERAQASGIERSKKKGSGS